MVLLLVVMLLFICNIHPHHLILTVLLFAFFVIEALMQQMHIPFLNLYPIYKALNVLSITTSLPKFSAIYYPIIYNLRSLCYF